MPDFHKPIDESENAGLTYTKVLGQANPLFEQYITDPEIEEEDEDGEPMQFYGKEEEEKYSVFIPA